MHNIEPYWGWRSLYKAEEDEKSIFYKKQYSEYEYTNVIYNHLIHPQWDDIESNSLLVKLLFADYKNEFAIIELIGEWNDVISNDIMLLKRKLLDNLIENGISQFIIISENVLNFHGDEDDYYKELFEDTIDLGGWVVLVNIKDHVLEEFNEININSYIEYGDAFNNIPWRKFSPKKLFDIMDQRIMKKLNIKN